MAASLSITTTDRLKQWQGGDALSTDFATWWGYAIAALSKAVEDRLGRYLKSEARTAYINVRRHQSSVHLKGYPITAIASIYEDASREFGSGTLVDDSTYTCGSGEEGIVWFDYELSAGAKALKVTYTGGMAADTATLATDFPELVEAAEMQLLYTFRNRNNIGFQGVSGGIGASGQKTAAAYITWFKRYGNLLPELVEQIEKNRSITERW